MTAVKTRYHIFSGYGDLTEQEKKDLIAEENAGIAAVMYLLDNVEPTYSFGREDNTRTNY